MPSPLGFSQNPPDFVYLPERRLIHAIAGQSMMRAEIVAEWKDDVNRAAPGLIQRFNSKSQRERHDLDRMAIYVGRLMVTLRTAEGLGLIVGDTPSEGSEPSLCPVHPSK